MSITSLTITSFRGFSRKVNSVRNDNPDILVPMSEHREFGAARINAVTAAKCYFNFG